MQLEEEGVEIPALDGEPQLEEYWLPIWGAFLVLNRCRPAGFGISPIPMSEIKSYMDLFPTDDPAEFVSCIKEMDGAFLKWHSDQQQSEQRSKR